MASKAYSFADCLAAIKGPNGNINLGMGAGVAEEGITVTQRDDKGTLTMGADGSGMHSLHVAKDGMITVRLLKTSPTNALLMDMYNRDTASAAGYGQNTISIRNPQSGDEVTAEGCAFRKAPDLAWGKTGNVHEWTFNAVKIDYVLGTGTPAVIL